MGLVVTNKNLPSAKAKSVVEVEVFTGTEFFGHKTEIIQDHTRLTNLNGDENFQHIDSEEKVAVQGLTNKAFGYKTNTANTYIQVPSNPLINFGTNNFTIETIARIGQLSSVFNSFIFQSEISTSGVRMSLAANTSIIEFAIYDGIAWHRAQIPNTLKLDRFYHFICSVVDGYAYLYIDCNLVAKSDNFSANLTLPNGLTLMNSAASISRELALLRIYKRGFDQSDVDYYYNAGRPDLTRLSYVDKVNKTSTGCVLELLPENATASKWLDTQNGLDGVTSGNPVINYGNVTPEHYIYPFKKYITLKQLGNGSGYSQYQLMCSKSGIAKILGGNFYSDLACTQLIGSEINVYKDVNIILNIKLTDEYAFLDIPNLKKINWTSLNAPNHNVPYCTVSELPIETVFNNGFTYIYGDIRDIQRDTERLVVQVPNDNSELLNGNFRDLPRGINELSLNYTNLVGDIKDMPIGCDAVALINTKNTVVGDLKNAPYCSKLEITGNAIISGDIGKLRTSVNILNLSLTNSNFIYTGGFKALPSFNRIVLKPAVGVFTSAMVDQLLIDLAAQITTAVGSKMIDLTGNCGAPTAASADARAKLSGLGFTIMVN